MKNQFILISTLSLACISTLPAQEPAVEAVEVVEVAEDTGLKSDPENDFFRRAEQVFEGAVKLTQQNRKQTAAHAHRQSVQLLSQYLTKYPNSKHAETATFYLASSYYQLGEIQQAKTLYNRVITVWKKGVYVSKSANYLGYDAYSKSEFDKAAKYFKITADNAVEPQNKHRALFQEAQCLQISNKNDIAAAKYHALLKQDKVTPLYGYQANLRLGHIYSEKKDYVKSITHFTAVTGASVPLSISSEASFHSGLAHAQINKIPESEALYRKVLSLEDDVWKPHAQVALLAARYKAKDYKGVMKLNSSVKVKLAKSFEGKRSLIVGQSALKLKRYDEARRAFEYVESLLPGTIEAFEAGYRRILCSYNVKSSLVPTAVDRFTSAYGKQFSEHIYIHTAYLLKAETLFDDKKFIEATKAYSKIDAKVIDKKHAPGLTLKRGWCLAEVGNHTAAKENFSAFITQFPKDPRISEVYIMRAKSSLALANRKSALKDFDEVIALDPKSNHAAMALQNSAKLKKEEKDYPDMIARYKKLLEQFPHLKLETITNAQYWIAWGNYQTKDYKDSIKYVNKAKTSDKGEYKKQLAMISVLANFKLKDKASLMAAAKEANLAGLTDDIPLAIHRWLGIQCFSAAEYKEAEHFLKRCVNPREPRQEDVYYWRLLAKSQYQNKHFNWALQAITHVINLEDDPSRIVEMNLYKGLCQKALEQPDQALKTAKSALEANPSGNTKAQLLILIGDINFEKKEYSTAARHYALVTNFYEDDELVPYALKRTIESLNLSGESDEAKVYEEILKKLEKK